MPPNRDAALALFHQGHWADAEAALSVCVVAMPDDADVLRALSQLRFMAQRLPEAMALMDRVLALRPGDAAALNSRGTILTTAGRVPEALEAFDAALRVDARLVRAHANRAIALVGLGRAAEALEAAATALALEPGQPGALAARGMALMAQDRAADAVPALEQAIAADPNNLAARLDLASALVATEEFVRALDLLTPILAAQPDLRQIRFLEIGALQGAGRHAEALARCQGLLAENPRDWDAAIGEGNVLSAMGRYGESLAVFSRVIAARAQDPEGHFGAAKALLFLRRHAEALAAFDCAIERDPRHIEAHCYRGVALTELERYEEALAAFASAQAIGPLPKPMQISRACTMIDVKPPEHAAKLLMRELEREPGSLTARVALLRARRMLFDWRDEDRLLPGLADDVATADGVVEPFSLMSLVDSPETHLVAGRTWVSTMHPPAPALWRGERYSHERIRLGYLSSDLRDHPVSQLAVGVFEKHDHKRFETIGFALGEDPPATDVFRARLARAFDRLIPVHEKSDEAIAQLIRDLEVDVLVDLNGQTQGARTSILAQRPAPVQAAWLGYPGTAGVPYMDYVIADPVVAPETNHRFFTECVATLPDSYLPADDRRQIGFIPGRAATGLPPRGFVFCAFNARHKIAPTTFDIWMRILKAVPDSVLWLSHAPAVAIENLRREASARGVDGARLIFAPIVAAEAHLGRQRFADLFLDTLPYNAHTTVSDALWAGLPVLTTPGRAFAGRVAASMLTALGMTELIAATPGEYQSVAVALAHDPARMAALREKLATQRRVAPAFDTERFCRHLEDAVATMHDRVQRGLAPQSFVVPARSPRA